MSETVIVKAPAWCPKCAAFHSEPGQFCDKCGAAMALSPTLRQQDNNPSVAGSFMMAALILGGVCVTVFLPWIGIPLIVIVLIGLLGNTTKAKQYAEIKARQGARIVCPQCQTRGHVTTQMVTAKKGISGGKATGAILTGGLSLLAVGLSRKEEVTAAHCANCGSQWNF